MSDGPRPTGETGDSRLRKKSVLHLILGGAAVHRCGNYPILNKALAAEVVAFAQKRLFPQAEQVVHHVWSCSATALRSPYESCGILLDVLRS